MKLKFTRNDLYRGFNLVSGIIPVSTVKHVLQGVRLEVKDNRVELTATDLEVLVRYMLTVGECEGEGGIILPAVRVNSILREWLGSGDEEILISVEGSNCTLRSKGGYFKVAGEDAKSFPEVHAAGIEGFVGVDGETMSSMVGSVVHAVSTVKARSTLCGVFVKVDVDDVIMVAADGNRLSYVKRKVENPNSIAVNGIVTVKCLTFLQRFVAECKGGLKLGIGESQIRFVGERGEVMSQLIDGQYPRFEDVVPKQNDKKVEVNRAELLSLVRMASFMTSEGYRVVKFVIGDGKMTLLSKAANVGEAELEVTVDYNGPAFEVSFNPDFILDALKVSENDRIVMEFGDKDSAVILRTGHEQFDVVMPIEM